jgi:rhodanese-related sulfurtransferase
MAGFVAENVLKDITEVVTPKHLSERPEGIQLVDVRTLNEHNLGHIPGSLHIPVDDLRARIHELDASNEVWVYCQVGMRGHIAARILKQNGFCVKNVTGGYKSYVQHQK